MPSHSILLIDDDEQLRSMLRRALMRAGYDVQEAGNGRQALARLAETPVQAIVTDIIMPDMEGIELILQLRRTRPELPILAMSAGGRIGPDSYLYLAERSGATRTIAKPFSIGPFLELVREVLPPPAK
jgi:DNA-binding NtrC family response regulator